MGVGVASRNLSGKGGESMRLVWMGLAVALLVATALTPYAPTILGIRPR